MDFVKVHELNDPAIIIRKNGQQTTYEYNEISNPRPINWYKGEIGPIGDFWRIWYSNDGNGILTNGNIITVDTIGKEVSININTGDVDVLDQLSETGDSMHMLTKIIFVIGFVGSCGMILWRKSDKYQAD